MANNKCKKYLITIYKFFYKLMGNGKNKNKIEKRLFSIFIVVVYFIMAVLGLELLLLSSELDIGKIGDFFGGVLNPILTFFTFLALLITIILQQKELSLSRKELAETQKATRESANALKEQSESIKLQNFENMFFNMISLHNTNVKNMLIKEESSTFKYNGKESKNYSYFSINSTYTEIPIHQDFSGNEIFSVLIRVLKNYTIKKEKQTFNATFTDFYKTFKNLLTQYIKLVYETLKLINTLEQQKDKIKYADIFKAQFSSDELYFLLIYILDKQDPLFIKLVEEFSFFDAIDLDNWIVEKTTIENLSPNTFLYNYDAIHKIDEKGK